MVAINMTHEAARLEFQRLASQGLVTTSGGSCSAGNCTIVGTCGACGGRVTVPTTWMGVIPPRPQCESCGALAAEHGPVIEMDPRRPTRVLFTDGTFTDENWPW